MVEIPALCRHCGLYIPEPGFVELGPGSSFIASGNSVTCPNCGGWADLLDGEFGVVDQALVVLSAPGWTVQTLKRVREILGQIDSEQAAEAAIDEIEELAPGLADWMRRVASNWTTANTLTVVQIIVSIVLPLLTTWLVLGGRPTDAEVQLNIQEKVTAELNERLRETPPPTQPSPAGSTQTTPPGPLQPEVQR
ncbi:hypothetical protein GS860_16185 [Rhodococcus hoagii]|nr:hypothetical protein [Prescottella equi]